MLPARAGIKRQGFSTQRGLFTTPWGIWSAPPLLRKRGRMMVSLLGKPLLKTSPHPIVETSCGGTRRRLLSRLELPCSLLPAQSGVCVAGAVGSDNYSHTRDSHIVNKSLFLFFFYHNWCIVEHFVYVETSQ